MKRFISFFRGSFHKLLWFIGISTCLFIIPSCSAHTTTIPPYPQKEISVVIDDNYPPYTFRDKDGNLQGISIDQWMLWQKKTGIKVNITGMDWDQALKSMQNGQFDVIDTLFYNDARARIYDFSKPYADIRVPIYFNNSISGINNIESLKGFTVAIKAGDSIFDVLAQHGVENIVEYDSYQSIIRAAANREVVIFIVDQPPAAYYLYQYHIENEFNQSEPVADGQFHRAVLKGNKRLLDLVNAGFDNISRPEYKAIDRKWFGLRTINTAYIEYGAIVLGAAILILIFLAIWNHSLHNQVYKETKNLLESETRYRALFDNSPISIWEQDYSAVKQELNTLTTNGVTDLKLYLLEHPEMIDRLTSLIKVTNVNQATLEMFDAKNKSDLLGGINTVLTAESRYSTANQLVHVHAGDLAFRTETINQTLSGRPLHLELSWSIVPGHERDMSKVIVSLVDITDRKNVEQEIKQLNRELEDRIRRRTIELERSNQDLEAFSYSVSHDLRAPLRAINGYSQIILNDHTADLDADVLRYLEAIRKNSTTMSELIDELLDFSRMGKKEITRMSVSPRSIIQSVLEELKPETEGRDIEFVLLPMPDVQADAVLLKEVFLNLIANAIKFTHKVPHAVIEIGTTTAKPYSRFGEDLPERNCLYIRDNGIGFSMNYYDKLFNMFQRLHSAEEYEGTGVGLALVKRIINRHGGIIWAKSEVGKGTTFYFTLREFQQVSE